MKNGLGVLEKRDNFATKWYTKVCIKVKSIFSNYLAIKLVRSYSGETDGLYSGLWYQKN